jgi:hypothetical protein
MVSSSSVPKAGTRAALAKGSLSTRARADVSNAGHTSSESNVIVIHSTSTTNTPNKQQQLGHYERDDDDTNNEGYGNINGFSSPAGAVSGSPGVHVSTKRSGPTVFPSSSTTSPSPHSSQPPVGPQATVQHQHSSQNTSWETEKLALLERLSALESKKEEARSVEPATQNPTAADLAHLLQESKEERERAQEKAHQLESTVSMLQRQLLDLGSSIRVNTSTGASSSNDHVNSALTITQPIQMVKQVPPTALNTQSPYVTYDDVIKKQQHQQQLQQHQQ